MTDGEIIDHFGSMLVKGHYMEVIRVIREDERARIREWVEGRRREAVVLSDVEAEAVGYYMGKESAFREVLHFLKEKE